MPLLNISGNLMFDQITSQDNLWDAYLKTQKGASKFKVAAIDFYFNSQIGLEQLRRRLVGGTYLPRPYNKFYVTEPKERLIYAPFYEDKIVQHAINNVVAPYLKEKYIDDSFACITERGNQRAVLRIQTLLSQARDIYGGEAYILKLDIVKFFYRISRTILESIIGAEFVCQRTKDLLKTIVRRSPGHIGLPLGNLTSQLLANLYMNVVDQYGKTALKLRYYLRYADDIFIVVNGKENAHRLLNHLTRWINNTLALDVHPQKSQVRPLHVGVVGLGFLIYHDHIRLLGKFKRKVRHYIRNIPVGQLSYREWRKVIEKLNAWLNVMSIAKHHGFIYQLLREFPYVVFDWQRHQFSLRESTRPPYPIERTPSGDDPHAEPLYLA